MPHTDTGDNSETESGVRTNEAAIESQVEETLVAAVLLRQVLEVWVLGPGPEHPHVPCNEPARSYQIYDTSQDADDDGLGFFGGAKQRQEEVEHSLHDEPDRDHGFHIAIVFIDGAHGDESDGKP